MKRIAFSLMLVCVLGASLEAQAASQPAPRNTNAPATNAALAVIARTPSSRIRGSVARQTNGTGQVTVITNNAYTELASGLCYEKDGQLADSVKQIEIVSIRRTDTGLLRGDTDLRVNDHGSENAHRHG